MYCSSQYTALMLEYIYPVQDDYYTARIFQDYNATALYALSYYGTGEGIQDVPHYKTRHKGVVCIYSNC